MAVRFYKPDELVTLTVPVFGRPVRILWPKDALSARELEAIRVSQEADAAGGDELSL
ncbi:hypothetical protein [Tropicibacter alexandrii]|uniref:hypothetical protein n=1 Tax=Tropicibacter alexandrii TaxID=2267683 RepID=UPI0013E8DF06|nr:hypothetical protein [Tropicibacter alexandrii]